MWQAEVSHKSEMAGPFNRGDTIINKHFTFKTNILNSMVKIENKQTNHLLCRFNQLVLHTTCDIPGDITRLNFMVKLVL